MMKSKRSTLCLGIAGASIFAASASADIFVGDAPYLSAEDSPFQSTDNELIIENFEDGALNVFGVSATAGRVRGPGDGRDSVDADDGAIDGFGNQGHSWIVTADDVRVDFIFDADDLGKLPAQAGVVWTDGAPGTTFIFKAWDANNERIGVMELALGDDVRNGTTGEDRLLGAVAEQGISRIRVRAMEGGFELDHLQFGFGAVPGPGALAALGLAGAVSRRRRRNA